MIRRTSLSKFFDYVIIPLDLIEVKEIPYKTSQDYIDSITHFVA
jgi:hypothetical protein